jgi:putative nucleotidyltransferase with HDIG domain
VLSTAIFLTPMAVSVGVASLVASTIPHPQGVLRTVSWWVLVLGASTLGLYGAERAARRFLPLAALMKMTMLFPDRAPSRLGVALRSGTTKDLERRLDIGQLAAEEPIAAAAEILSLAGALNAHDRQTRGHSERVRAITDMIAEELDLSPGDRDRLRWSALLHDIGKLTVHSEVLNKTEKLSDADWEELKRHPVEGARLIAPLSAWLGEWSLTVAQHHEKHDGSGYPYGLAGEEISLGARIVSVADSFEVMTATRAYKRPSSASWARQELTRCAGTQFDPVIVRAFLNISIGRLRRAMGPLSWLVDVPVVSQIEHLGQVASAGSRTALLAGAVGASALAATSLPASDAIARPDVPAHVIDHASAVAPPAAKLGQVITFDSHAPSPRVGETTHLKATGGGSENAIVFDVGSRSTHTCSLSGSVVSFLQAGRCVIDANQSGDARYDAAAEAKEIMIVRPGLLAVNVTSNAAAPGSTLVFTASVAAPPGGPRPSGSVTWVVRAPDGSSPPCSSTRAESEGSTETFTCSVADAGAGTYSAVATYSGDGNYRSGTSVSKDATIAAPAPVQEAPTTGSVSTTKSAGFSDQLATGDPPGSVSFATSSADAHLAISSSGELTTLAKLPAGSYKASGTDATALGAAGTWSYTLTVTPVAIVQGGPGEATVSTANSAQATDQLVTTGQNGTVSFTTTSPNANLSVASSGAVATAGTLAAGTYTVSGTDADSYGDGGTWSYALTVTAVSIDQTAPTTDGVSTTNSAQFASHLATSGEIGAATFATTTPDAQLLVASSGAVATAGTLAAGTYTVSGTDADSYGDNGTWSYTLTVTAASIDQIAPTTDSVSTTNSSAFSDQLATNGQNGVVTFVTTTPNANLAVASSGAITTAGTLATGSYTVSGTDADSYGDTGEWGFTLVVSAVSIAQVDPDLASVSTTNSAAFTDQLATTGQNGAVSFVTTTPNANLAVASSGAVTTSGTLAAGSYTASGTDADSYGDTGTWSYTLTVVAVTINQSTPTAGSVSTTNSAAFTDQLATTGQNGAVSFDTTTANANLAVASSGAMTTSGTLAAGSYTVSGTDADPYGDSGAWSYTLTVTAVPINQSTPMTGSVSTANSAGFTAQLSTAGQNGTVSFTTTSPIANLSVASSGAITTSGTLAAGSYTVSGTDADSYGDSGTWSYTLTVNAVPINQSTPMTGSVSTASSAGFTDQLTTTGQTGAVTFVTTSPNAHVAVTTSGAMSTTGGTLSAGSYTVSGTDADSYGDTGTWSYTLTVTAVTINQSVPTTGSDSTTNSAGFTDQLATTGQIGAVTFTTTSPNAHVAVTTSGAISTVGGILNAGSYTVSGTDADSYGDTGSWSFTLTVTAVPITQGSPLGASESWGLLWQLLSPNFTDQLATSGQNGAVTFVTTSPNANLSVSSTGAVTTSGILGFGTYAVSGTDSDAHGDTGTWSYTLSVGFSTIDQQAPTTAGVSTTSSAAYTGQLATDDPNGSVTFVTTSPSADVGVSSSGVITTSGTLAAGSYTVSGTDTDSFDGAGTWSFTLTVSAVAINQIAPVSGTVVAASSGTFVDQLVTSGQSGAVNFVTTVPNANLTVSSSGALATTGTLASGTYTVSGTDTDAYGDAGTWTYTLTVQ